MTPTDNVRNIAKQLEEAADRTLNKAEKAGKLAQSFWNFASGKEIIPVDLFDIVSFGDPAFKDVGSETYPEVVRYAQAVAMTAQLYLNNELTGIDEEARSMVFSMSPPATSTIGQEPVGGFHLAAVEIYQFASDMLKEAGFNDEAERLAAKAADVVLVDGAYTMPRATVSALQWQFGKGIQDLVCATNDPDRYLKKYPYDEVLEKLDRLTMPPASIASYRPGVKLAGDRYTPKPGEA